MASATKSNGISISMPYWDERFAAIAKEYPQVKTSQFHIDILAAHLVRNPTWFDVIVGSNLFGDILSDLGPATTGTIAIAPGGNINPEREFPSMFEPVHGSAPDIAGKGIANPIGQIWSGAMMLEHLGTRGGGRAIVGPSRCCLPKPTCAPPTWAARRPAASWATPWWNWSPGVNLAPCMVSRSSASAPIWSISGLSKPARPCAWPCRVWHTQRYRIIRCGGGCLAALGAAAAGAARERPPTDAASTLGSRPKLRDAGAGLARQCRPGHHALHRGA